jgi:hypothetical protein
VNTLKEMYLEFEREIRRIETSVNTKDYVYDSINIRGKKEATKSTRNRKILRTFLVLLI